MTVINKQIIRLPVAATLRMATEDDLPKLEWYGAYTRYRKMFRQIYQDALLGRQMMWVADVGSFPVGQVFVNLDRGVVPPSGTPYGYLYALRVMQPFRGLGLGSALVRAAEHHLVEQAYHRATIAVGKDNAGALRLYERLGYRTFGDDPGCWQYEDHTGKICTLVEPCWLMEKSLTWGQAVSGGAPAPPGVETPG